MDCPEHFCKLTFPLNAYARGLWLEEGGVDSLHYGFDPQDGGIAVAQRRSTEFLLQQLAPPPARILEVGIGLGTTAKQLRARGYDYVGVTPDAQQIAHSLASDPSMVLVHSTFVDAPLPPGSFDIVTFQESSQYMAALPLLRKAHELLVPGGQLLVLDEVETARVAPLIELAEKNGFTLSQYRDMTPRAAPSIDYLVDLMNRHRPALLRDLGVSERAMDALVSDLEQRKQDYHANRHSYCFFELRRG